MRVMLKVVIDTRGRQQVRYRRDSHDGDSRGSSKVHPEATHFTVEKGKRTAFVIIFDMTDSWDMPTIGESSFRSLGAEVDFTQIVNFEDLMSRAREVGADVSYSKLGREVVRTTSHTTALDHAIAVWALPSGKAPTTPLIKGDVENILNLCTYGAD
jgi:hypothetical protein